MSSIQAPVPKIKRTKETKEKTASRKLLPETERQVTVHFLVKPRTTEHLRIWKSTVLIDKDTKRRSALTHAENIGIHPQWIRIDLNMPYRFTLYFEGLPKSCKVFDLIEDIPESGGFIFRNIPRTTSDVYQLVLE
jgi:hypothetical protein